MGLFSSKKETRVATTITRVIEDGGQMPDSVAAGTIKAILEEDNIPDRIIQELANQIGIKGDRMFSWAEDNHPLGIPKSAIYNQTSQNNAVLDLLTSIEGQAIKIDFIRYTLWNFTQTAWFDLIDQYTYNPTTNELPLLTTAKGGKKVYLKDFVTILPLELQGTYAPDEIIQEGFPPQGGHRPSKPGINPSKAFSEVEYSADVLVPSTRVVYEWESAPLVFEEESVVIPLTANPSPGEEWVYVRYTAGGNTRLWRYLVGQGTYPAIDDLYEGDGTSDTEFFPFIYFRKDKINVASDPGSAMYKSSKKMLKYLGADFDSLCEEVHGNPGIEDVEQAMMMFMVPLNTSHPLEQRYVFDFFDRLYNVADWGREIMYEDYTDSEFGRRVTSELNAYAYMISDAYFRLGQRFEALRRYKVAGSIGPVGTHQVLDTSYTFTKTKIVKEYDPGSMEWIEKEIVDRFERPAFVLRRQITKTVYTEIVVANPQTIFYIYGSHNTVGNTDNENLLMIPVDRAITSEYSLPDKEQLYARSLHMIFNSRVEVKIKWYQQGWFKIVMIVIAIIITVVSMGSDGGTSLSAALAAGSSAAATAALMSLLTKVVVSFAIQKGLQILAKATGVEFMAVLALVFAAYGAYTGYTSPVGFSQTPWAMEMLKLSVSTLSASTAAIEEDFKDLLADSQDFRRDSEAKWDAIKQAQDLLEQPGIRFSPLILVGETPDSFYQRTVHSGNIGTYTLDGLTNYYDLALELPSFMDTLGGPAYG